MEKTAAQKVLDEKLSGLSADKRELLELLFSEETPNDETQQNEFSKKPLNEIEIKLKNIWEEVLRVGSIGLNDNFFTLGGDSLHCIQIVTKARKENIHFSTADLFETQTIEKLGQRVSGSEKPAKELKESDDTSRFTESGLSDDDLLKLLQQV